MRKGNKDRNRTMIHTRKEFPMNNYYNYLDHIQVSRDDLIIFLKDYPISRMEGEKLARELADDLGYHPKELKDHNKEHLVLTFSL